MWRELVGTIGYKAGTSGTVTLPAGAQVLQIVAHASSGGATVSIFGGDAIPVVNGADPIVIAFRHTLWQAQATPTIVFTGTDAYFVEFIKSGNT